MRCRPSAGAGFRPPSAAADRKVRAPRERPRRVPASVLQYRHGVTAIEALAVQTPPPGKRVLWVRGPSGPLPGRTAAGKRRPRRVPASVLQPSWRHCDRCACSTDSPLRASACSGCADLLVRFREEQPPGSGDLGGCPPLFCNRHGVTAIDALAVQTPPSGQARALGARTFWSASGKNGRREAATSWIGAPSTKPPVPCTPAQRRTAVGTCMELAASDAVPAFGRRAGASFWQVPSRGRGRPSSGSRASCPCRPAARPSATGLPAASAARRWSSRACTGSGVLG